MLTSQGMREVPALGKKQLSTSAAALVAVLTAALFLSVTALGAMGAPGKGKPGKDKGKTPTTAQYSPSAKQYGKNKVAICHKGKTIHVAAPAVKAHLRHEDALAPPCPRP